jgi:hypothetical protein
MMYARMIRNFQTKNCRITSFCDFPTNHESFFFLLILYYFNSIFHLSLTSTRQFLMFCTYQINFFLDFALRWNWNNWMKHVNGECMELKCVQSGESWVFFSSSFFTSFTRTFMDWFLSALCVVTYLIRQCNSPFELLIRSCCHFDNLL